MNESKSGFEGLRVWAGWSGATERTKGQSRGSEAGKRLEEWSGRRGAPVGCLNSGLFTAVGGKNPTLLEFAWFTGVHTSDTHGRTDVSPARCRMKLAFVCAAPLPPSSLSDYSFFKEQTSPWWAEFINKFGFDCMRRSAHHELICIHTSTLVDVPTTR